MTETKLKDSTRRALRTWYQGLLTLLVAIPVVVASLQSAIPATGERWATVSAVLVGVVSVVAAVTKVINSLEAAGIIPAFLKAPAATPADPDPAGPADAA